MSYVQELLDSFTPPLDSSLVLAVANEYGDEGQVAARDVLSTLAAVAIVECAVSDATDSASASAPALSDDAEIDQVVDDFCRSFDGPLLVSNASTSSSHASEDPVDFLASIFLQYTREELTRALAQAGNVEVRTRLGTLDCNSLDCCRHVGSLACCERAAFCSIHCSGSINRCSG